MSGHHAKNTRGFPTGSVSGPSASGRSSKTPSNFDKEMHTADQHPIPPNAPLITRAQRTVPDYSDPRAKHQAGIRKHFFDGGKDDGIHPADNKFAAVIARAYICELQPPTGPKLYDESHLRDRLKHVDNALCTWQVSYPKRKGSFAILMSQNGGEDPREAERLLFEQIMIRGHACAAQQLDINLNTQAFSLHGLQTTKAVLPLLVEEENKRNEHGPDAREVSMFDGTRITGPAETQLGHAAHATISHFHSHHAGKGSTRSRSPDSASQFKFSYEESQDVLKKFKDFHNRNLGFVKAKEELFKEIDTAFQTSSKPSVATIFRACMARAFVIELLIKGRWEHAENESAHAAAQRTRETVEFAKKVWLQAPPDSGETTELTTLIEEGFRCAAHVLGFPKPATARERFWNSFETAKVARGYRVVTKRLERSAKTDPDDELLRWLHASNTLGV